MDESTTLSSSDQAGSTPSGEVRPAVGTVKTFVKVSELRRLLGQLMAAELVRMMVTEGT